MTDLDLLIAGCTVSFVALLGIYAYIRESFLEGRDPQAQRARPERSESDPRRAA
jgi:hypothetical protein